MSNIQTGDVELEEIRRLINSYCERRASNVKYRSHEELRIEQEKECNRVRRDNIHIFYNRMSRDEKGSLIKKGLHYLELKEGIIQEKMDYGLFGFGRMLQTPDFYVDASNPRVRASLLRRLENIRKIRLFYKTSLLYRIKYFLYRKFDKRLKKWPLDHGASSHKNHPLVREFLNKIELLGVRVK